MTVPDRAATSRNPTAIEAAAPAVPAPLSGVDPAAFRAAADAHAQALRPANTTRSYSQDWRTWTTFCSAKKQSVWVVDAALLEAYVAWMWHEQHLAPSTIKRKLSGTVARLREAFGEDQVPRHITTRARTNLGGYINEAAQARQPRRGRGPAPVAELTHIEAMVATCGTDAAGLRDRALILIGLSCGGRSAELAGLTAADITEDADRGLLVDIRVTKLESSKRVVAVPRGRKPSTCPVTAWRAWRAAAGHEPGDPAFTRINKGGRIITGQGMSAPSISAVITRRSEDAGLDPLTAHGLRAGMATAARTAGHDDVAIAEQGGWKPGSVVMASYTRRVDRWEDNAMAGVL